MAYKWHTITPIPTSPATSLLTSILLTPYQSDWPLRILTHPGMLALPAIASKLCSGSLTSDSGGGLLMSLLTQFNISSPNPPTSYSPFTTFFLLLLHNLCHLLIQL